MSFDGIGAGMITAGLVIGLSGVKNVSLQATLTSLLRGQVPADVQEAAPSLGVASGTAPGAGSGASAPGAGGTTDVPPTAAGGTYTNAQVRALWIAVGGSASKAAVAACIAFHESSYRVDVTSSNPDGGTNVGLWQLDTKGVGAGHTVAQLQNPLTNARLAVQGSGNGTNWADWSSAPECGV